MPKQSKPVTHFYKIRKKIPDPKYTLAELIRPPVHTKSKNKEQFVIQSVDAVAPAEAQPFLKWVGGKAQLLKKFDRFFPDKIERYIEVFLGGGAVFFHLKHRFPEMQAFLRDNNDELINTYQVVRDSPQELIRRLDAHHREYQKDRKNYYYKVRDQHHISKNEKVERAARMIFLNKTCFNGLWRVNSRGQFNVPIGSYKNPALYNEENLRAASFSLQGMHLDSLDFRETLAQVKKGDFVYIDPPYFPLSPTANFTSYTKEDFGASEQRELADLFKAAAKRGARLVLSNSDTPFINDLYQDFEIHKVQARRAINCDGSKRGEITEVVVLTF